MTLELFLGLLTICAAITAMMTQALKKVFEDKQLTYSSNMIALVVAIVIGLSVSAVAYLLLDIPFSALNIIMMFLLAAGNWLGAMVGYDKVMQLITQISKTGGD
ncbi:MAG: hypothetical protein Q4G60_03180 [bacterium]|nr:hypothetical protein [bacterium]